MITGFKSAPNKALNPPEIPPAAPVPFSSSKFPIFSVFFTISQN
jgi:hypothetical protein